MFKNKLPALLVGLSASFAVHANVVITEYVEGGGSNKAIEISNLGTENVDLAPLGYTLSLYSNGATSPNAELKLQGLLIPNSSIVIYNNSAVADFQKPAPQGIADSTVINFNGDDTVVLSNSNGVVDAIGQIGVRQQWSNADGVNTKDKTLRRKATITQGNVNASDDFTPHLTEWTAFAKDTADGIGCSGEQACDGSQAMPGEGTPVDGSSGGGNNGDGDTGGICTNCPDLTKVADAANFNDTSYYQRSHNADTSNATSFQQALNQDINTVQKVLSYSEVWTALTYTDEDPTNPDNVLLLYTGNSIPKNHNASGNNSNNQDYWNREHVWAKSHGFPESYQAGYTDINHLRPADVSMNTTRSDNDFNEGGSAVAEAPTNFINGDISFEPRDQVKGDVARMLFYMDVRYDTNSTANMPDLQLVDNVDTERTGFADGYGKLGKLCTLLKWHEQDPVDEIERKRNTAVYEYQGNRNPFIDHPEWAQVLYQDRCPAVTVAIEGAHDVNEGETISLTANATGNNLTYAWQQTAGTTITLTDNSQASISFTAPDVDADTSFSFSVTATNDLGQSQTHQVSFMVKNIATPAPTPEPVEPSTDSSGGGSLGFGLFALLFGFALRKRCI